MCNLSCPNEKITKEKIQEYRAHLYFSCVDVQWPTQDVENQTLSAAYPLYLMFNAFAGRETSPLTAALLQIEKEERSTVVAWATIFYYRFRQLIPILTTPSIE